MTDQDGLFDASVMEKDNLESQSCEELVEIDEHFEALLQLAKETNEFNNVSQDRSENNSIKAKEKLPVQSLGLEEITGLKIEESQPKFISKHDTLITDQGIADQKGNLNMDKSQIN